MKSKIIASYLPEIVALRFFRSKPGKVTVNITDRCNQHCIYCEIGVGIPTLKTDRLSSDDLIWIIDQMAENDIRNLSICGGEPFLFEGIIGIVAYAAKKNIRSSITTNGMTAWMLSEKELDSLKESNALINISIDSFRDDIQAGIRGNPQALTSAVKSMEWLIVKKIPVNVLTVISKYNYTDLFAIVTNAYKKGAKEVLFQPVISASNYPDRPVLDQKARLNVSPDHVEILVGELKRILKFERKHQIKTNVYRILPWIGYYLETAQKAEGRRFFDPVLKSFFCREIDAIIDITYDGGIQPCGLEPAMVSIRDNREDGLLALWSEATVKIRNDLLNGRYYEVCNACCHHFSRNMLASVIKYPFRNRSALIRIMPRLFLRILSQTIKHCYFYIVPASIST